MAHSPRPTLAEISAEAGVSVATVSRVLNGKPGVAPALRRRIQAILSEHRYIKDTPVNAAPVAGLIVPDLTNPVFGLFADAIEAQLAIRGYNTVLSCIRTSGDESEFAEMLLRQNAEGVIIIAGTNNFAVNERSDLLDLQQRGLRIVLVNGPAHGIAAPTLTTDFAHAVRVAFRHLRSLGHTTIGFAAGPKESFTSAMQIEAFSQVTVEDPDSTGEIFVSSYSIEGGALAARTLLTRSATALICASDAMALGAIREIGNAGLRVPHDVSVIGFDDSPTMPFVAPPLTTIRQPVADIAQSAVNALLALAAGSSPSTDELRFEGELIIRASTAPPSCSSPTGRERSRPSEDLSDDVGNHNH